MKEIQNLFLDVDDVLVDFAGAACGLFGMEAPQDIIPDWDLVPYLGTDHRTFKLTIDGQGPEWWQSLEPLPWSAKLYDMCLDCSANLFLLTSPGPFAHSCAGKRFWIADTFGPSFVNYVITTRKQLLASNEGATLIDDSPINCSDFTEAGGTSVVFPGHGNVFYHMKQRALKNPSQANIDLIIHHVESLLGV